MNHKVIHFFNTNDGTSFYVSLTACKCQSSQFITELKMKLKNSINIKVIPLYSFCIHTCTPTYNYHTLNTGTDGQKCGITNIDHSLLLFLVTQLLCDVTIISHF